MNQTNLFTEQAAGVAIEFTVYGTPQQAGSKQAYVPLHPKTKEPYRRPGGGIVVQVTDSNKKAKPWMKKVAAKAAAAWQGPPLSGALELAVVFCLPRPKGHFGTGRNAGTLKRSAPEHHAQSPDLSKLLRCLEDGITQSGIWTDDKLVCQYGVGTKRQWAGVGDNTDGYAAVRIAPLTEPDQALIKQEAEW